MKWEYAYRDLERRVADLEEHLRASLGKAPGWRPGGSCEVPTWEHGKLTATGGPSVTGITHTLPHPPGMVEAMAEKELRRPQDDFGRLLPRFTNDEGEW